MNDERCKADIYYEEVVCDVKVRLSMVDALIDQHEKRQKTNMANWGYVGDLNLVRGRLEEIINFLK